MKMGIPIMHEMNPKGSKESGMASADPRPIPEIKALAFDTLVIRLLPSFLDIIDRAIPKIKPFCDPRA